MGVGVGYEDERVLAGRGRIHPDLLQAGEYKNRPQEVRKAYAEKRDEGWYAGKQVNQTGMRPQNAR